MYEFTEEQKQPLFQKEFHKVGGAEPRIMFNKEYNASDVFNDYTEFTWYVSPFKNGSTPFYTTNADQKRDIDSCFYSDYFYKPFTSNNGLVALKDKVFWGFKSGVLCISPARDETYMRTVSKNKTIYECYCDTMGNCYYSPTCRGWFMNQIAHPQENYYQDFFAFATGKEIGMTICAPVNRKESKNLNATIIGTVCTTVVPSYTDSGNYIWNMYFNDAQKSNYILADNQDIWSSDWNTTKFQDIVWKEIDFQLKSEITNFQVMYEFPESSVKIAYFNWDNSKQQAIPTQLILQISAIIISNISVTIEHYQSAKIPKRQKPYVVGLIFESSIIEKKIMQIQQLFFRNFLVYFMLPFLIIVVLMLMGEVVFIVCFSRQIFCTINDLYDKINMLSKQQREKLKNDKNKLSNQFYLSQGEESLKSLEGEGDALMDKWGYRRLESGSLGNGSIQGSGQIHSSTLDVLQDYEGRESCMEVTKLYRAANKLIKTLSIARTAMMQGNDNTALLSYNEVAHLFNEKQLHQDQNLTFSNLQEGSYTPMKKRGTLTETKVDEFASIAHSRLLLVGGTEGDEVAEVMDRGESKIQAFENRHVGICYNNLACIHAKKKNFSIMTLYFEESIRIEEQFVNASNIEKNYTSIVENVRLGYRYYNYGYSQYKQYIHMRNNPKPKLDGLKNRKNKCPSDEMVMNGALNHLKLACKSFQTVQNGAFPQRYKNTKEKNLLLANVEQEPSQNKYQRTFKDVCLYLKLVMLELKIESLNFPTAQVLQKLGKLSQKVFAYIQSEEYEEMPEKKSGKGIWYFTGDYLTQYTLFLHGLLYERRTIEVMTAYKQIQQARKYYVMSISSSLLFELEHGLIKRALKHLIKLPIHKSSIHQHNLHLVLSKFYLKQRSVQVIMEQCNEAPYTHDVLLSFIKRSIFEKLRDSDYFSFISMRSGKHPSLALPLEQKSCNSRLKLKTLNEFNFSSKMNPPQRRCNDLSIALLSCINAAKDLPQNDVNVGGVHFMAPMNWIVAIVGPQAQNLGFLMRQIIRAGNKRVPNIIIIGVNIKDGSECDKYRALCHLTQEGQFVNLDFNHKPQRTENEEYIYPKYFEALQRVEAALQLYTQKTVPLICEHIDFN
ncbi:hypothetical protein FGO68_gene8981 [Halteria grandinella]|uniref:Uncharacterized protein n=1 Tax=Halteria grandinella TaxID=5974 RepID=A0A8J8P2I4_HALGN|nr:hypothetical protein FGO68_gene8981 [Halteria grandinella]